MITMTQLVIDNKKYVLIPEKEYSVLQKKASLKVKPEKLLSLEDARLHSKKLIRKWALEKFLDTSAFPIKRNIPLSL